MKVKAFLFAVGIVVGIVCGWLIWGDGLHFGALCPDGTPPDANGCCGTEVYTDLGDLGFNCCPDQGDCFPPIK